MPFMARLVSLSIPLLVYLHNNLALHSRCADPMPLGYMRVRSVLLIISKSIDLASQSSLSLECLALLTRSYRILYDIRYR